MATAKSKSKSASKKAEPQTMEELLAQTNTTITGLKRGDIIEGTITEINNRSLLLDIGAKTEGMVIDREFAAAREYISTLNVGDTIEAYVSMPENESGQIILSLRSAAENYNWGKIAEWKEASEVIRVRVKEVNRGGAIVSVIDEIDGFIPGSQFSQEMRDMLDEIVEREIEVRILDFDRDEDKLILSEKLVSEAEDLEKRAKLIEMLAEAGEYQGTVTRVVPFGVFVKLDVDSKKLKKLDIEDVDLEGLVHISELSWQKVNDPADFAAIGDTVKVKVINSETQGGKLSLSIKQLATDPWEGIMERFPVDKQVTGKIVRVAPFGVFVELDTGIEGLIHVSKLTTTDKEFVPGQEIQVYIESINPKDRRISLGMVLTQIPVGYR